MPAARAAALTEIARIVRGHPDAFRDAFHRRLLAEHPEAHGLFPLRAREAHPRLPAAAAWFLEHADSPEAQRRAAELGRAQRRYGFPAAVYRSFAVALRTALRAALEAAGAPYTRAAATAEGVLEGCCARAAAAALADARAGVPAAAAGKVIAVERPARRVAVVSVDAGLPVPYAPGQRLPATAGYTPGTWVPVSPALPSDGMGQLQFHLDLSEGSPTRDLGRAQVGDQWTFGRAEGGLGLDDDRDDRDVVMIAHGTGWAPLRAIVTDLLARDSSPRVHVIMHAEYPGELYDLARLHALARSTDWLAVTAAAAHDMDEWWVRPRHAEAGITVHRTDEPVALAGDLGGTRVVVAGPTRPARASALAAWRAGAASVRVEDWAPLHDWSA